MYLKFYRGIYHMWKPEGMIMQMPINQVMGKILTRQNVTLFERPESSKTAGWFAFLQAYNASILLEIQEMR